MPDPNDLLGPDGKQLHKEPNLIVLKYPKKNPVNPQLIVGLGKQTGCNVISMPMNSELMMGELAMKEIVSTHSGVHAILQLPFIHFAKSELETIRSALNYVVKQINAKPGSAEEILSTRITQSIK